MSSIWEELSQVDVSQHIEKKGKLSYLSWAWAWAEVKKRYPNATYSVIKNPDGLPYFQSEAGLMCFVSVTINDLKHEMWLPVLDHNNKALKIGAATMFDVNKTIMRCLVKCIAMFGLGHYIYAGEDLPQQPEIDEFQELLDIMEEGDAFRFAFTVAEMSEDDQTRFFNGAEKGNKVARKDKWRKLVSEGYAQADDLADEIKRYCSNEDADSIKSELNGVGRSALTYIGNKLTDSEKQFVRSALKNA